MVRLWLALAFVVALGLPIVSKPTPALAASCGFALGFKTLHDLIPIQVGACLVDEHHNPTNGDGLQETTGPTGAGGLLVWRKADNWTAYTDGNRTWINGPFGLEARFNAQRFLWESGGATIDWVAESNAERQICATLPANATRELVADCWAIVQKQKVQALVAQYAASTPVLTPIPTPAPRTVIQIPSVLPAVGGVDGTAIIVADDGQYLGLVSSNQFSTDSICNPFGHYGSRFSSASIRDEFGQYGSPYGPLSAYNPFASRPPMVIYHQSIVAYLTKNTAKLSALDPDTLIAALGCSQT